MPWWLLKPSERESDRLPPYQESDKPAQPRLHRPSFDPRIIMRVVLSLALVTASLFVVLAERYDPNSKHWAFGTLRTIMGFWLRGVR